MTVQKSAINELAFDSDDDITEQEIAHFIDGVRRLPDPPVTEMFVQEAMQRYRASSLQQPQQHSVSLPLLLLNWLSHRYWQPLLIGCLLFGLGFMLLQVSQILPDQLILPMVGCIPMFVILSQTAKQLQWGGAELARSFRYSVQSYVMARLCGAAVFSLLLSSLLYLVQTPQLAPEQITKQMLLWCIPVFINTALALLLSVTVRSYAYLTVWLLLIPVSWIAILSIEQVAGWLLTLATIWLLALTLVAGSIMSLGVYFHFSPVKKQRGFEVI